MPYIKDSQRDPIESSVLIPFEAFLETQNGIESGELNFMISSMIDLIALHKKSNKEKVGYDFYNNMLGVLEGVKLEMYRRATAPYEDQKLAANGEVYFHG